MKNATPSEIPITKIIEQTKDLIAFSEDLISKGDATSRDILIDDKDQYREMYKKFETIIQSLKQLNNLGYFSKEQYKRITDNFFIKDENILDIATGILSPSFIDTKEGYIQDIVTDIYPEVKENRFVIRLKTILEELKKCISKTTKASNVIKGLKQPIVWEQITIILKGLEVEIKQNKKSLGDYSIEDLGFPKFKGNRNVTAIFFSLFTKETEKVSSILDSKNNKNQKLKSSLFKILINVFNTNKDPIEIDKKGLYKAKFRVSTGGELRINEHRSGGQFLDNYDYED
jgi:hypothetical protein